MWATGKHTKMPQLVQAGFTLGKVIKEQLSQPYIKLLSGETLRKFSANKSTLWKMLKEVLHAVGK